MNEAWWKAAAIMGSVLLLAAGLNAAADFGDEKSSAQLEQEVVSPPGSQTGMSEEIMKFYGKSLDQAKDKQAQPLTFSPRPAVSRSEKKDTVDTGGSTEGFPFGLLPQALDKDQDGLSDLEEVKLATEVNNSDTDQDGYIDGLEVVRGYNPRVPGPGDKITYQSVVRGLATGGAYEVTGVRLRELSGQEILTVTGTGPASSLVAIIIQSQEQKIWIVRTDETGRFLYNSADTLGIGPHAVYAAAASADGVVREVSEPVEFDRLADRIVVKDYQEPKNMVSVSRTDFPGWAMIGGITLVILIVLAVIGGLVMIWLKMIYGP